MSELLISADSHVLEPADLWTKGLPAAMRERAPRVFYDQERKKWMFGCAEVPPQPIAFSFVAGVDLDDISEMHQAGYDAARPGGWDPNARLEDMALDGISAEVLYPSLGLGLYWIQDPAFQEACFRVYNDWLAAYCQAVPDRFVGVPMISMWNVERAVAELERCHRAGLHGAMIWLRPPDEYAFKLPRNDPFWAAAQELQMPISLHILTDHGTTWRRVSQRLRGFERYRAGVEMSWEIQTAFFDLIFSGVLEHYPRLTIVSVENEYAWLGTFLRDADNIFERNRREEPIGLSLRPSEYYHRQMRATFFNDPIGPYLLPVLGCDTLMWSSDYPHQNSTWPHSRAVVDRDLGSLSATDRAKLVRENVVALYGLKVPAALTA